MDEKQQKKNNNDKKISPSCFIFVRTFPGAKTHCMDHYITSPNGLNQAISLVMLGTNNLNSNTPLNETAAQDVHIAKQIEI